MNKRINGKIVQYVILQSAVRSILVCVSLLVVAGGINVFLGEGGINIVFMDQFLIISIGLGNAFDVQNVLCGKAHIFTGSRKRIFRNCMYSAVSSALVFSLWRTLCQYAFYGQYVREFMEDEPETLVLTRIGVPEMFVCNLIIVLTVSIIILCRFSMGRDYGFLAIGINMKECSEQMRYLAAVRKNRRTLLKKMGQWVYRLVEFVLLVTVMVGSTYVYFFQLQTDTALRAVVYAGIFVIGVVFFLLAKRRFRPEYM